MNYKSIIEKARNLLLVIKIVLIIVFSLIWFLIASNFDLDMKSNWMLSGLVIAVISSVFFPIKNNKL